MGNGLGSIPSGGSAGNPAQFTEPEGDVDVEISGSSAQFAESKDASVEEDDENEESLYDSRPTSGYERDSSVSGTEPKESEEGHSERESHPQHRPSSTLQH